MWAEKELIVIWLLPYFLLQQPSQPLTNFTPGRCQVVIKWLVFQFKESMELKKQKKNKNKQTWNLNFVIFSGLWLNLNEILHQFFPIRVCHKMEMSFYFLFINRNLFYMFPKFLQLLSLTFFFPSPNL